MSVALSTSGRGVLCVFLGLLAAAPGCKSDTGTVDETQDAGTEQPRSDAGPQVRVPAAPAAPTAVAGNGEATVTWRAPDNGGSAITRYTVTSSPGGIQAVVPGATTTNVIVRGLTPGTAYTFTVFATNVAGAGPASSPSNAVTPRPSGPCPGFAALPAMSSPLLATTASGSTGEYTPGLQLVQAPDVWDANRDAVLDPGAPTGTGIKVCVVGDGIDLRHPELKAAYLGGRDFVEDDDDPSDSTNGAWGQGVGTSMAGVLAAQFGSAGAVDPRDARMDPEGVVGVAPGVGLLVARVLDTQGRGSTADVIAGVQWCKFQGARVVVIGFGSPIPNTVEEQAFASLAEQGVLFIAAAGSGGNDSPLVYPAGYASVLAVGAVGMDRRLAPFSSTGSGLSLVAPGVDILTTGTVAGRDAVQELSVAGQSYDASPITFGARGAYTGPLVNCGLGDSVSSCQGGTCEGFVALIGRGTPSLAEAVGNVRAQGARAVILAHDAADGSTGDYTLGEPSPGWPPAVSVSQASGQELRSRTGNSATVSVTAVDYTYKSNTAVAAAHAAGVAALVWSARPSLTPAEVRQLLENSAMDLGAPGRDTQFGYGLVRARSALDLLNSRP